MFGLIGFWAGDNVNFLSSSGAFDDYSLPSKERLEKRNRIQLLAMVIIRRLDPLIHHIPFAFATVAPSQLLASHVYLSDVTF
jgi:hypothetical protein